MSENRTISTQARFNMQIRDAVSLEEAKKLLLKTAPGEVTKVNEVTLGTLVNKATNLQEAKDTLTWLRKEFPEVKVNEVTLNTFLNKTTNLQEAKDTLTWLRKEFPEVKVNEVTLGTLVNKATNLQEAKDTLTWLRKEFPEVKVNEVTLGTLVNKATNLQEAKDTLTWLRKEFPEVKVNEVTLDTILNKLIRFRKEGKIDSKFLEEIENICKTDELKVTEARVQIKFICCYFIVGNHKKATEYIQDLMSWKNLNEIDIERLSILIFAFLPPNHPIYQITKMTLQQDQRTSWMVAKAEDYSRDFWDILDTWQREQTTELAKKYSSGNDIFITGKYTPVDGVAARVGYGSKK